MKELSLVETKLVDGAGCPILYIAHAIGDFVQGVVDELTSEQGA